MSASSDIKTPNKGAKYWRYTIGVETLPALSKEKRPDLRSWEKYQREPVTDEEFQSWLDDDKFKNGVCILPGKIHHRSDRQHLYYIVIDGDKAHGIKELLTRNGHTPTLQEVAKQWIVEQHKDNTEKAHFGFYSPIPFLDKLPDSVPNRVVVVSPSTHKDGHPYEIIGTKDPVVLSELQALQLKQHINQICIRNGVPYLEKTGNLRVDAKLKRMIQKLEIDESIEIAEGQRNDMLIAVADSILFNHSHKFSEEKLRKYFEVINDQLCKPEPLDDRELNQLWDRACKFVEVIKEREKENGNGSSSNSKTTSNDSEDEDIHLPDNPEYYDLDKDVFGILNFNPPILAVARSKTKQIVKAKVIESEYKDSTKQTQVNRSLTWINAIVDAIPIKVVRNDNPLDERQTSYTVTFVYKGSDKPFTIGPATITKIVEELTDKGRVLKRLAVTDALTSLITSYGRTGKIMIDDQIPTPGYYWIDGRIVGYHITQRLNFDPWNNEEHRKEALECTRTFDEWQQRNKKKTALPSSLKWTTLAPFAFITKTHSRGVDKWLPNYYLYLTTDTGKTTLMRDAVLAPWGIYSDGENSNIHFKGPGSLDSPSKFGIAASQTTLPVLGDEIGSMFSDGGKYNKDNLLEIQKFAVQNKYIRSRFTENILALASFGFTSNDPPPNDGATRRRFFAIQFSDNEVWTADEKMKYESWMNEVDPITSKSRREKLSVYGDFVASYVIKNPELVLNYSSYSWHEPAITILKEFYKAAGVTEPPEWLNLLAEQTIVQEAKEERQFELRGFLLRSVLEAYRRDAGFSETKEGVEIDLTTKIMFCLNNRSIPFLHLHNRKHNQENEVAITSDIHLELKRHDRTAGAATMETLASKIPGFKPDVRKVGGITSRVVCGPVNKFVNFLNPEISDSEEK